MHSSQWSYWVQTACGKTWEDLLRAGTIILGYKNQVLKSVTKHYKIPIFRKLPKTFSIRLFLQWMDLKQCSAKTVGNHLQNRRLKFSIAKSLSAVFHIKNKEVKRDLKVKFNNKTLQPVCSGPKCIAVYVGQDVHVSPTPQVTSQKADNTCHTPMAAWWLGLGCWGNIVANNHLRLVHSTAEYYVSTWCRSPHTLLINPVINDALSFATGCLRPTPVDNHPFLARIHPAELRRKGAKLSLALRAMEPGNLLHSALTRSSGGNALHLKSRFLFEPAAQKLISSSDGSNRSAALWTDHRWNAEWLENTMRLSAFIPDIGTHPHGMALPITAWTRLNRLRKGVARFSSCLHKWGMALYADCEKAQKNSPLTMLSFTFQYNDLRMGRKVWRFWMMRQLNGYSTPDLVRPFSG